MVWFLGVSPIDTQLNMPRETTSRSSMDSDLEAFSHFPTRDSFAAMSFQTTALPIARINGSSRTKLNYYWDITSSVG